MIINFTDPSFVSRALNTQNPTRPRVSRGTHATPDADINLPVVPQQRGAGEQGDRGLRDPGGEARVPSYQGHAFLLFQINI